MAIEQVLAPKTAEETAGVEWDSDIARRSGNDTFVLSASLLAGAETATVEILVGNGTWHTYNIADTPLALDDAQPHATLPAGPLYRFKKSATAGACGIYVQY